MLRLLKYDTLAAFVGPNTATGNYATGDIRQLHRTQSSNFDIEINRTIVKGLGRLGTTEPIVTSPYVNLNLTYLLTDGGNEHKLGFLTDGIHGSIFKLGNECRDYFLLTRRDGADDKTVLAVGNGYLEGYQAQGRVGDIAKGTLNVRGYNINFDADTSGNIIPHVDVSGCPSTFNYAMPEISQGVNLRASGMESTVYAIKPGDIEITFGNNSSLGFDLSGSKTSFVQGFALNVNLARSEAVSMGYKYPFFKNLDFPVTVDLSADFTVSEFVAGKLSEMLCGTYDMAINMYDNACVRHDQFWENSKYAKLRYTLKNMKFAGCSYGAQIDGVTTASVKWQAKYDNLLDSDVNFFISGDYGRVQFVPTSFLNVTGESDITGYNLQPFIREITYDRILTDMQTPDYIVEMKDDLDINSGVYNDLEFFVAGNTGEAVAASGAFGTNLTKTYEAWQRLTVPPLYHLPTGRLMSKWGNLNVNYESGWKDAIGVKHIEISSGSNPFYVRPYCSTSDTVNFSLYNIPAGFNMQFDSDSVTTELFRPYYFNNLYINADLEANSDLSVEFKMEATNNDWHRTYTFNQFVPKAFNIVPTRTYSDRFNLWLDAYDWKNTLTDISGNQISGDGHFVKWLDKSTHHNDWVLSSPSGGHVVFSGLNNKTYMHLTDTTSGFVQNYSGLGRSGLMREDLREFTLGMVFRASGAALSDQYLLVMGRYDDSIIDAYGDEGIAINKVGNDAVFSINHLGISKFTKTLVNACTGNWHTLIAISNYASGKGTVRLDGQAVHTASVSIPSAVYSGTLSGCGIMYKTLGDVGEIIMSPYAFTGNEITDIERYLRYKWNI